MLEPYLHTLIFVPALRALSGLTNLHIGLVDTTAGAVYREDGTVGDGSKHLGPKYAMALRDLKALSSLRELTLIDNTVNTIFSGSVGSGFDSAAFQALCSIDSLKTLRTSFFRDFSDRNIMPQNAPLFVKMPQLEELVIPDDFMGWCLSSILQSTTSNLRLKRLSFNFNAAYETEVVDFVDTMTTRLPLLEELKLIPFSIDTLDGLTPAQAAEILGQLRNHPSLKTIYVGLGHEDENADIVEKLADHVVGVGSNVSVVGLKMTWRNTWATYSNRFYGDMLSEGEDNWMSKLHLSHSATFTL